MCLPPGRGGVPPQSVPESDQLDCVSTVVMSNHCKVTMFVSIQYMLYEPVPFEHFLGQKHLTPSESGMPCVALVQAGTVQGKITPMCGMLPGGEDTRLPGGEGVWHNLWSPHADELDRSNRPPRPPH